MRGGSGAAGPAGAGSGANAKGNILHKLLNQSLILYLVLLSIERVKI